MPRVEHWRWIHIVALRIVSAGALVLVSACTIVAAAPGNLDSNGATAADASTRSAAIWWWMSLAVVLAVAAVVLCLMALAALARRHRQRLHESNQHYRNLLKLADGFVLFRVRVTDDGAIRLGSASPSCQTILGHPPEYYDGRIDRFLAQVAEDERLSVSAAIAEGIRSRSPVRFRCSFAHPRQPHPRHLFIQAFPADSDDRLDFDGVVVDLTAEAEADRQQADLQRQLQLAMRRESLGLLAGGVAHDFNNLLGAIRGNAELIAPLVRDHPQAARRMARLQEGVDRATGLVRQILAYAGKGSLAAVPLDVAREIRQLCDLLRHSLPAGIAVELDLADGLRPVRFDPAQFQQVVVNLLINAAEAYEGKPGTVQVRLYAERAERDGRLCLEVQDRGCGMDDATLSRIFEPYFTTKANGHGLGLPAVQGILRSAGAEIACESSKGAGTCFRLRFPTCDPLPTKPTARATQALPGQRERLVLVVDDDELVREATAGMLTELGWSCYTAAGAEDAHALLAKGGWLTAAVIDCRMPGTDGPALLVELRQRQAHLPAILVSGMVDDALALPLDRITRFLTKPYTQQQLAEHLRLLISDPIGSDSDSSHSALTIGSVLHGSAPAPPAVPIVPRS